MLRGDQLAKAWTIVRTHHVRAWAQGQQAGGGLPADTDAPGCDERLQYGKEPEARVVQITNGRVQQAALMIKLRHTSACTCRLTTFWETERIVEQQSPSSFQSPAILSPRRCAT